MHIFGVFLLFIVLTQAYVSWDAKFTASKEQHVPLTQKAALTTCSIDISYDNPTTVLDVTADCGSGLGAQITGAHIHQLTGAETNLVFGSGTPIIFLIPGPIGTNTSFTFSNETKNIDFICNGEAYINIHTTGEEYNVRANLVGMDEICNLGPALPTTGKIVKSWGPEPAVGEMKSWTVYVDIVDPESDTIKCSGRVTYKPGNLYVSAECTGFTTENIIAIHLYDTPDNTTARTPILTFFDESPSQPKFKAVIPFTFEGALTSADRDKLCAAIATTPFAVVIETDSAGLELTGKVEVDACPAVGTPAAPTPVAPAPSGAQALSFTVYLTVFLALFSKWFF
jgi:hypothetical protein